MSDTEINKLVDELYNDYKKDSINKLDKSLSKVHGMINLLYTKLTANETYVSKKGKTITNPKEALSAHLKDSIGDMFHEADRDENVCGLFIPYCLYRGMKKEDFVKLENDPNNADLNGILDGYANDFKEWMFSADKDKQLDIAKKVYFNFMKEAISNIDTIKSEYKKDLPGFFENNAIFMCTYSSLQQTLFTNDKTETYVYDIADYVNSEFEKIGIKDGFDKARDVAIPYHTNNQNATKLINAYKEYSASPNNIALKSQYEQMEFSYMQLRQMTLRCMNKWDGSSNKAINKTVSFGDYAKASAVYVKANEKFILNNANLQGGIPKEVVQANRDKLEMKKQIKAAYLRDLSTDNLLDRLESNVKTNIFKKPKANSKYYDAIIMELKNLKKLEEEGLKENLLDIAREELLEKCNQYLELKNPNSKQGKERYALVTLVAQVTEKKLADLPFYSKIEIPSASSKVVGVKDNLAQKQLMDMMRDSVNAFREAAKGEYTQFELMQCVATLYTAKLAFDEVEENTKFNSINWNSFEEGVEFFLKSDELEQYCDNLNVKDFFEEKNVETLAIRIVREVNEIKVKLAENSKEEKNIAEYSADKEINDSLDRTSLQF